MQYYHGNNRKAVTWKEMNAAWPDFVKLLTTHRPTGETMAEWALMPKERKDVIKDVGGFVGGVLRDGKRHPENVLSRTMLTLDADDARHDLWDTYTLLYGHAAVLYQTHSWTPEKPRARLVIPFSRPVEEHMLYRAISYHIVDELGADQFDPTTHEVNRLMYYPSLPSDAPHVPLVADGDLFDVDAWIAEHPRWDDVSTWPVTEREMAGINKEVVKLGDPGQKPGLIGAFCRAYDIELAIETFLYDRYEPGTEGRYTWVNGTTSNGVQVLDNGVHAISHHSTDPISGRVVNSWDLVRLHLYGQLEEKASGQEMEKLANADALVIAELDAVRGSAADVFAQEGRPDPRAMFFRYELGSKVPIYTPKFVADWYAGLQPVARMNAELYRYVDGVYVRAEEHFGEVSARALDVEYTSHRFSDALSYLLKVAPVISNPFGGGLLNVRNGLLNVETGLLELHTPDYLSTVQIPWEYDPAAVCPTVDRFFAEHAGGYEDLVWYMFGSCLLETMRFETAFILLGEGGNGKGTTLDLVTRMLGEQNVSNASLHKLESDRFAPSDVIGKLANIQSDLPSKILEAEGITKQLISGDRIRVERKNKDGFQAASRAKLLFSCNDLSVSKDNSEGFFRRWCIIPFKKKFHNKEMREQMPREMAGVFAKSVAKAMELNRLKQFPGQGVVEQYRLISDGVYAFAKEICVTDENSKLEKSVVFSRYQDYCRCEGIYPVKHKTFSARLEHLLGVKEYRNSRSRYWSGLALQAEDEVL